MFRENTIENIIYFEILISGFYMFKVFEKFYLFTFIIETYLST